MKIKFLICSVIVFLTGCNSLPSPKEPTGDWTPVNQPGIPKTTTPGTSAYLLSKDSQRSKNTATHNEPDKKYSISLEQAIEHYIPSTYRVEVDPDVNLKTEIAFDSSTNWLEALGQGMSEANIEFATNLYKKSATIKRTKLSLADATMLLLPADYTVFSDAGINQNTQLHFDTRKYWVEALSNGVAETGIELTIDFTKKIIYLTSASRNVSQPPVIIK